MAMDRMDERLAVLPARASSVDEPWVIEADEDALNLALAVHGHSQTRPEALAVSYQGRQLNYGEFARQAAGLAARLQSGAQWPAAGEQPRVGILASRSADACVAVIGASWAGATYVPIGLKLPEERILTIMSLCRLSALIVDEQGAKLLSKKILQAAPPIVFTLGSAAPAEPIASAVTWLDPQRLAISKVTRPVPVKPDDAAYIIFTSGTTGVPKGVVVTYQGVRNYIQSMTPYLGLRSSDRLLETFELSFDVSVHNMFCTWEAGASLHILPPTRMMSAISFVRENELTVWNSVPSLIGMLQQLKALGSGTLPKIRLTQFGGEQLPRGVVNTWRKVAPHSTIFNLYGPTEVTVTSLALRVDGPPLVFPGRDVVSIGQPLHGCEAVVLDDMGNPAADGSPGELALAGVQLALGYLNAPELTAARFINRHGKRWYLTGDLAVRDISGNYHCLGRLDNQVKVLGYRVELEEIDAHVRQVVDAGLVATVAWPLLNGAAQGLVTFVGAPSVDQAQIVNALKARLPVYMLPARVLPIEPMPVNANGKVDRKALLQLLEAGAV